MRELVNIGIGQAGIQISESLIEIYAQEHSIGIDGKRREESAINLNSEKHERKAQVLSCIFDENEKSQLKARFMMIDSEPDVIDALSGSKYNELLNPFYMIAGKESANTYPAGYYRPQSNHFNEIYENSLKKIVQSCDSLEGFLMTHGIQGGTGSGTGSLVMQILSDIFPKIQSTNFFLNYEALNSTTSIGSLNAILGLKSLFQFSNLSIMFDNFSLNRIFEVNLDVQSPNYKNLNSLIAQVHSSYTLPMRFVDNKISCDIKEIQTNLIHFPELKWVLPSFAPLVNQHDADKGWGNLFSPQFLVSKCFDSTCQLACQSINRRRQFTTQNYDQCKKISSVLLGRGNINENEFIDQSNIFRLQKLRDSFREKSMKIGLSPHRGTRIHLNQANKKLKTSLTALTSTHECKDILDRIYSQFKLAYRKKAFRHWFTKDGMREFQWQFVKCEFPTVWGQYQEEQNSEQNV